MNIKYCKSCLFPNTKPDLYFNDEGICDACISADKKHNRSLRDIDNSIDWSKRELDLHKILKEKRMKKGKTILF